MRIITLTFVGIRTTVVTTTEKLLVLGWNLDERDENPGTIYQFRTKAAFFPENEKPKPGQGKGKKCH